jgi:AraC family transcriptional regulator
LHIEPAISGNTSPAPMTEWQRRGLAPHKLQQVLCFIEERITEPIGIRDLASEVRMSQFHFARMFKEAMGDPPHEYITRVRMERAKRLLSASDLPLRLVATSVGYQTQAHFTGVFHKRVGVTPRTFRVKASELSPLPERVEDGA